MMLSFVTVVYSCDYPLLELQALSMARFLDISQVGSIQLVMNDRDEAALERALEPVLTAYGPLAAKLRILRGDDLLREGGRPPASGLADRYYVDHRFRLPLVRHQGRRGDNGYRMQQALKLAAAARAPCERVVILETRNLLLRHIGIEDFFTPDGRGKLFFAAPGTECHRAWWRESLNALDVQVADPDEIRTTTFSTPFPVSRQLALGLCEDLEARNHSVQELFASPLRPSEFMLLNAYCLKTYGDIGGGFEDSGTKNAELWPAYSPQQVRAEIERLERPETVSFGLHDKAVAALPEAVQDRVFAALEAREICDRETARAVLERVSAVSG